MTAVKKTKRNNAAVAVAAALLMLATAVFAYLNAGSATAKKELEINAEFDLIHGGSTYRVTMQEVLDLEPVDFEAVMRTSVSGPAPVIFTGVELAALCAKFDIEISPESTIQITALDGYASAVTGEEALAEGNVYLCIRMGGEALKPHSEGGPGPYYLVIRNTEFAQRWCKCVGEILVK